MTKARKEQISLEQTPFYHCYVRCVRRAYLCGDDVVSGENFDHRKQWIVSRLRFLSGIYAVDICAYAVMSNHYHVVLHVDQDRANHWTQIEVVERWKQLYRGHLLVDRWLDDPKAMDKASLEEVEKIISEWRERLASVSWFMRCVNETIARMANEEDACKGRFWEGRFRSQALLDDAALLTCMAYVDLNPVRAAMESDLVGSDFTSIQQRIFDYARDNKQAATKKHQAREKKQQALKNDLNLDDKFEAPLMPFDGSCHTHVHRALPFTLEDYLALVDQTGRAIRADKRGSISSKVVPLISQLGINPDKWIHHIQRFGDNYASCAGSADNIVNFAAKFDSRWGKGKKISRDVYLM